MLNPSKSVSFYWWGNFALLVFLLIFSHSAMCQENKKTVSSLKSEVFQKDGIAIGGYDVVAFFTEKKAVAGSKQFTYYWKGVNWQFAGQQNLDLFRASPQKYLPQYGGYCAYGTAEGHKAPTQVDTWTVADDKLYFNYNQNVKKLWIKNQKALIDSANVNWEKIKDKE